MNIVITILSIVTSIIALLLIIAIFTKKGYKTRSETIMNVPQQIVFDYLKQIKNQDNFNKWIMVDPDMKRKFKGTDGSVGFIYAWNGTKKQVKENRKLKQLPKKKILKQKFVS